MMIVTISRELGSGGDAIAATVAERLRLDLIDRERLQRAAQSAGALAGAFEELDYVGEATLVARVLKSLRTVPITTTEEREQMALSTPFTNPLAGIFAPVFPPASIAIDESVRVMKLVIRDLARRGNVLIVGQGAQVLLANWPGTLHVRIVAPLEYRIATVRARTGLSRAEALRRVQTNDRARAELLRRFYNAQWNDPHWYHVVINTERVPRTLAVETIVTMANRLGES